jgi:glycosyltransferase involved in cell wall biosynthesis
MKVSICITVFNEEKSIAHLLDSLLMQTTTPAEIVIVDGGSKDKTVMIVKHFQKKDRRIKLLVEPGSCAHGRNTSIELARYPIIITTDAGCIADRNWVKRITDPFKHGNVGMVAGYYKMLSRNPLQKAMNSFHGITPDKFNPESFLPSARSVAFRKELWERVGGFSEKLEKAGEDTLFFYNVVKTGTRIVRVKDAVVIWIEPASFTLMDSIKKFYQYAKGDAQAGIWWHPTQQLSSHNIKISLIFLRYILGIVMIILSVLFPFLWYFVFGILILYIFWAFRKVYLTYKDFRAGLWGIVVQISSDISVMMGFVIGLACK